MHGVVYVYLLALFATLSLIQLYLKTFLHRQYNNTYKKSIGRKVLKGLVNLK